VSRVRLVLPSWRRLLAELVLPRTREIHLGGGREQLPGHVALHDLEGVLHLGLLGGAPEGALRVLGLVAELALHPLIGQSLRGGRVGPHLLGEGQLSGPQQRLVLDEKALDLGPKVHGQAHGSVERSLAVRGGIEGHEDALERERCLLTHWVDRSVQRSEGELRVMRETARPDCCRGDA
jgi:hypothetical protein